MNFFSSPFLLVAPRILIKAMLETIFHNFLHNLLALTYQVFIIDNITFTLTHCQRHFYYVKTVITYHINNCEKVLKFFMSLI